MKKSILMLVCLTLVMFLLAGCLPEWLDIFPVEEEAPTITMEANVNAVLVDVEGEVSSQVAWSIENTGELFIREYIITFDVFYPMNTKDNILITVVGYYLEIGAKHEGMLELVEYDSPETVSVSWELFE